MASLYYNFITVLFEKVETRHGVSLQNSSDLTISVGGGGKLKAEIKIKCKIMGIEDNKENDKPQAEEEKMTDEEKRRRSDIYSGIRFIMGDINSFWSTGMEECSIEELEEIFSKFEELKELI